MRPGQTLSALTARVLETLEPVLKAETPDRAPVQGDATTTLAATLAAFYHGIPVGHVEQDCARAILRSLSGGDESPADQAASRLAFRAHPLAPPPISRARAFAGESIHVTENTGLDAVRYVRDLLDRVRSPLRRGLGPTRHGA
jgi:UDP-N-acetylglucosamine 2-epimerase (non-hydrolysing)